jgi:serine/threonine protein kinase
MDIVDGASISGSAVSGQGSKAATGGPLSLNEFERAMGQLFPLAIEDGRPSARRAFNDSELQRISRLLELSGKPTWALRPRTYSVLRFISRLDAMDSFIAEGLCDISFPYSEKTLPEVIQSQASRSKFLEFQPLVLLTQVQAADVENDLGRHRHFAQDGNVFFQPIRSLGTGGFGEVDHVWSRLSLNEFARKRIPRGKTFKKDKAGIIDFEKELSALKRLSHHHLVKFVGSYTDPKYVGLIMSPVADSNLAEFLRITPFPTNQKTYLRRFYGCLGSAVLYLHHQKIRHKDIKPGNILVHGENVLLTDFGTSLDWTNKGESTTASRPSAISVPYCSPEVMDWEVSCFLV